MNVTRIDETVSADPLYANCKSISHGYTAAQIFFGTKSHTVFVYEIKSRSEFPIVYDILPKALNIVAHDDHVGNIEWSIKTIMDCNQSTIQGHPYCWLPKLMVQ